MKLLLLLPLLLGFSVPAIACEDGLTPQQMTTLKQLISACELISKDDEGNGWFDDVDCDGL